jgi:hypothetical protein
MRPMAEPDIPNCLTITGRKGRMGEPPVKKQEQAFVMWFSEDLIIVKLLFGNENS